jgi:peptide/nickel transport system substrate-binding protein
MRTRLFTIVSLIVLASMVLTACGTPATAPASTPQVIVQTQIVAGTPQQVVVTATPEPAKTVELKSKDPTTFTMEEFGEPETLDPALDYETGGLEILQNVYETLVWYNREKVDSLVPVLATELPTKDNGGVSADGLTYTFKIRKGVKFHSGSDLTPADVAYTFQRGLLQGSTVSPQWLFAEPLLGTGVIDVADLVDSKLEDDREGMQKADPAKMKAACETVTKAISADDAAGTVTFKLAKPWGPFLVTLAGGWGAVQEKKWVVDNGGWDGSCDTWQKFYAPTSADLNKGKLGTSANGTGPYMLDHWTPKEELVMKANPSYWATTPIWEGGPSGAPKLQTVIIKFVTEFSTRFATFQAGDADEILPGSRADWPQLDTLAGETCDMATNECKPTDTPDAPLRRWTNVPQATRTDIFLNFNISTTGGNTYIGSGQLDGNGIPPDFFNDIHVRKAFAYCFDYDTYIKDVMQGEATQAPTVMLPGEPGYDASNPMYKYDPDQCTSEFKASTWKSKDGKSLWDIGFHMTAVYNSGNTARQTVGQIFQNDLSAINEKFVVEVTQLPWAAFLEAQRAKKLPLFISGWQEDIPDPHNWLVPYASAAGTYSGRQSLPKEMVDQFQPIIDKGVAETDPAKRAEIYKEFNKLYYDNVPTILTATGKTRYYTQRWVNGFYYNPLYSENYYYALSKN